MLDLNLSFEQQRNRFERHHKLQSPAGSDYTRTETGYADQNLDCIFKGWQMAMKAQPSDEVTLYFSVTYGWLFEYIETGSGVESPDFEGCDGEEQAITWAKEQGLIIVKIEN